MTDEPIDRDAYSSREGELRALARVIAAALGVLLAYWDQANAYPPQHPYRHAARMVQSYLQRRYL
jgi:hypothetical protein